MYGHYKTYKNVSLFPHYSGNIFVLMTPKHVLLPKVQALVPTSLTIYLILMNDSYTHHNCTYHFCYYSGQLCFYSQGSSCLMEYLHVEMGYPRSSHLNTSKCFQLSQTRSPIHICFAVLYLQTITKSHDFSLHKVSYPLHSLSTVLLPSFSAATSNASFPKCHSKLLNVPPSQLVISKASTWEHLLLLVFIMNTPFQPHHLHTKCSVHSTCQPCHIPSPDWESHPFPLYLTTFSHSSNSMQTYLSLSSLQQSSLLSECFILILFWLVEMSLTSSTV